jgi:hypothetical protein
MTFALALVIATGIALPHRLRLERIPPVTAATLWSVSLALRALAVLLVALYVVFYVPDTALFASLTHWCWHTALPFLTSHLGLDGNQVGDAATILPGLLVIASLLSVSFGVARAARTVRRALTRNTLGPGPRGSVIVPGPEVMLAAAGLARPRVLVTAGALIVLDDEELAAGLDHEHGHIARRHRFVLVLAEVCHGVGRVVPGSRTAVRELSFHLERDADQWSVARRNDPYALASAICKAATIAPLTGPLAPLGGSRAAERLGQLMDAPEPKRGGIRNLVLNGLAVALVFATLATAALVPSTALAGAQQLGPHTHHHCEHHGR